MEFVVDIGPALSERELVHNYYAAFGIVPVEVGAATASATMTPDNKGKGNKPRALGLFATAAWDENLDVPNYNDVYNWTGLRTTDKHIFNILPLNPQGVSGSFDVAGYQVFPHSLTYDDWSKNEHDYVYSYYDEVSGEQEFVNLVEDIDMSEFDLVFFINTPKRIVSVSANGLETGIAYGGRFDGMWERLMNNILEAQREHGFSIWAPQPEVALGLGIINDYDVHSMLRGVAGGPATPWGKPGPDVEINFDTRALNRHRIVSTVDGLTDWGGWIVKDYVFGYGKDNGADFDPPQEAWDFVERPNGLLIGDEFFYPQDLFNTLATTNWFSGGGYNQRRTVLSVPPSAVLAGTVVTKENATHYDVDELADNPWKENATSIIVKPGDSIRGLPVGGKIYVNFMDSLDGFIAPFKKQIVPPNEEIQNVYDWETPEMREWEYSSTRVTRTSKSVATGSVISIPTGVPPTSGSTPDGKPMSNEESAAWALYQKSLLAQALKEGTASLIVVIEEEKYETEFLEHYSMIARAMHWLADREVLEPGDKVVRATPMTADAGMTEATVVAERDNVFEVAAALANATIVGPDEADDPDVNVLVLPMEASAEMTGYGRTIGVEPMTATATMVENFDLVHASGEQVVLYLNYTDAIVYLKEDI